MSSAWGLLAHLGPPSSRRASHNVLGRAACWPRRTSALKVGYVT